MNWKLLRRLSVSVLLLLSTISLSMATPMPKFTLLPRTATSLNLRPFDTGVVTYRVSNNTRVTRTLTTVPVTGITQITTGTGICPRPFTLATGQSCLLSLSISGAQLTASGIHGGPVVCKTIGRGDNNPSKFLCSQPASPHVLHINAVDSVVLIRVSPRNLSFPVGSSGTVTITNVNTNRQSANNITAHIPAGSGLTFTNNCPARLPVGQSCTIVFSSANSETNTLVAIHGSNTSSAFVSVTTTTATISAAISSQQLEADGTSTVQITVTNSTASAGPANAIQLRLPSTWSGVSSVASSGCSSLAPGSSNCIFTLTATNPNIANTIIIHGSNTNTVQTPNLAFTQQGFLVFAVDSVARIAKVIYPSDNSFVGGIVWDPCGGGFCTATAATDFYDGETNTANITTALSAAGIPDNTYAASLCYEFTNGGANPVGTWYLPAICELGSGIPGLTANCIEGTPNIYDNLVLKGFGNFTINEVYWSSTQADLDHAWYLYSDTPPGGNDQGIDLKTQPGTVRCARQITY
ncbi:hypothetical protein [Legionella clemsonensis]|uniref:Protein with a bacterial immunoglobulin-like domain protein n=1 Tax=Legionella clemsonensis TaxID=1867846 RepID=A0A222NZW4_9GAMM|nr:hypothetical protein [Legionella clemsonensis]ASQ45132.1 hypothetical protein clem_02855 [Legionella clemsonensis]